MVKEAYNTSISSLSSSLIDLTTPYKLEADGAIKISEKRRHQAIQHRFKEFSQHIFDPTKFRSDMKGISLTNNDIWFHHADFFKLRVFTIIDTGRYFFDFGKSRLDFAEWFKFIAKLCVVKNLTFQEIIGKLATAASINVVINAKPTFRTYFTGKPVKKRLSSEVWQ